MPNLKPYRVRISETMTYEVDIEAQDEDQAENIALETVSAMAETERASHIVDCAREHSVAEMPRQEVLS